MNCAATIWVEGRSRQPIDALRRRWDSQHDVVGPHMTVVYPQPVELTAAAVVAMAGDALSGVRPFRVTIDRASDMVGLERIHPLGTRFLVAAFPGFLNPIVLLPRAGASAVLELRQRLDGVFHQPPELLDHPPFVTVAQGPGTRDGAEEAASTVAATRPRLSFEVRSVDILAEDASGAFTSAGVVLLGG